MNPSESLNHTKWDCKYHIVWIPKYRKKTIFNELRPYSGQHFWARGYYVSTVGKDEATVCNYIRHQEDEDRRIEQMNLF